MNFAILKRFGRTKAYDLLVALPLVGWFAWGAWGEAQQIGTHLSVIANGTEDFLGVLQLIALFGSVAFGLLLIAMLCLRSLPRAKAPGILPRLLAVLGTFLGIGFWSLQPHLLPIWLQAIADIMLVTVSGLEIFILMRLGKSFAIMAEARELVTDGPYAIVRHPLYVVEEVGILAMLIQYASPLALVLTIGHMLTQYARTIFEERILSRTFAEYGAYQARTWRFIPRLF